MRSDNQQYIKELQWRELVFESKNPTFDDVRISKVSEVMSLEL